MTLRDKLVATLAQQYDQYGFNRQDAADAILAAIREHMTSDEVIHNIGSDLELNGAWHIPHGAAAALKNAILAALGGEP